MRSILVYNGRICEESEVAGLRVIATRDWWRFPSVSNWFLDAQRCLTPLPNPSYRQAYKLLCWSCSSIMWSEMSTFPSAFSAWDSHRYEGRFGMCVDRTFENLCQYINTLEDMWRALRAERAVNCRIHPCEAQLLKRASWQIAICR